MLEQLRENGREVSNLREQAESAVIEAVTAEKEAVAVVTKAEGFLQVARQQASATVERARGEKQEAVDTKQQALEISKPFRDPRRPF